jgi:hypothetical protein
MNGSSWVDDFPLAIRIGLACSLFLLAVSVFSIARHAGWAPIVLLASAIVSAVMQAAALIRMRSASRPPGDRRLRRGAG